ncbi:EF-hand domain-containing protein [Pinirhizobacter sp.]|jgi:hypothetical protein|uniref:EF-hand domain-containing protein n=1 Tax=Pinirhizobacter sp. TaxID=2950432 RepID=UPI002F404A25
MQLRHVLAAGAITLLAGPALALQAAQPQPHPNQAPMSASTTSSTSGEAPSFDDLDKNHKGSLGRSDIPKDVDALKQLRAHFGEADADHNGRLSPAEYNTYVAAKPPGAGQH